MLEGFFPVPWPMIPVGLFFGWITGLLAYAFWVVSTDSYDRLEFLFKFTGVILFGIVSLFMLFCAVCAIVGLF